MSDLAKTSSDPDLGPLREAIALSEEARKRGNMPFGAVLVAPDGTVLARGENAIATERDITSHAEINAIRAASKHCTPQQIAAATMYASGEPCPMCSGAMIRTGVRRLVFGIRATVATPYLPGAAGAMVGASTAARSSLLPTRQSKSAVRCWRTRPGPLSKRSRRAGPAETRRAGRSTAPPHCDRTECGLNSVLSDSAMECTMKYSTRIKPISYLKANAAEIVRTMAEERSPLVITQNGEAKAVMQDVASYEQAQETMALLKILALGNRQIEEGKVVPAREAIRDLRAKLAR